MVKVADVLTQKYPQFNTVSAATTVYDALQKMFCENVDFLIVMENGKFVGVLTEHDIAAKAFLAKAPLTNVPVKELMTTALPVITTEESIEYAMQMLEHSNVKHLAVYNQFEFQGVLSSQDIMKLALNKRKEMFEESAAQQHAYPWNY
jgi:predicted transcriptional regulator